MKYNRNFLLRIIGVILFLCSIGVVVFDKNKIFGFIFFGFSLIFIYKSKSKSLSL